MNPSPNPVLLIANWLLPIDAPPIERGGVLVSNGEIVAVAPALALAPLAETTIDYGNAVLMPGLVNVHTHLDYTLMRGLLEDIEFFPWIRELTSRKAIVEPEDWIASATIGAAEAVAAGVTTLGDCTDSGAALSGAKALGMRGLIYQEVFGIDPKERLVGEIVADLAEKVSRLRRNAEGTLLEVGISPHAPYTVRGELFTALADYARTETLRMCIHAAESLAEGALFLAGTGGIAEMYGRRGIEWLTPGQSTVAYLERHGCLSPRTLLVHGVGVSASDRFLIAKTGVAWAHCPKSNAKLGNGVAPLGLLRGANGENPVGLGSDSVASNNGVDLFEEMRFAVLIQRAARQKISILSAKEAVEMATLGGAKALGLEAKIGSLTPGKRADLCVVRTDGFHALPVYNPYNALVYAAHASDVIATWVDGKQIYSSEGKTDAERFPFVDLADAKTRLAAATAKQRDWTP